MPDWTDEHTAYLREHYLTEGARACAKALGRTQHSVRSHARRLGVARALPTYPHPPVSLPNAVDGGRYTLAQLAEGFGCSRMLFRQLIHTNRLLPIATADGSTVFSGFEVARFAVENALWVDRYKAKIDMVWLMEIVGRLGPVSPYACRGSMTDRVISLALARNDLTHSAIAEALGSTVGSVGVIIANARTRGIDIPRRRSLQKAA